MARYRNFVRPERQRQFLIGRVLLRHALSQLAGIEAAAISLSERPGQAPLLDWAGPAPGFSLSHSGPWVACAVSAHTALGLDIEVINPARDLIALAEQAFEADELEWLRALASEQQVAAFYCLWSLKEARYKLAALSLPSTASCIAIPHPDISLVLCSAVPFTKAAIHQFLG